jgi:hypothetical protein
VDSWSRTYRLEAPWNCTSHQTDPLRSHGCWRRRSPIPVVRAAKSRTLNGVREPTIGEALAILRAIDLAPEQTLALALTAGEDAAIELMQTELAQFVGDLFCQVPQAIADQLGERIAEIRPRWARGTAKRIARLLSDHIAELARHDAAFGVA